MNRPAGGPAAGGSTSFAATLSAVIACVAVFGITIGFAIPLISLVLDSRGVSAGTIGALSAVNAVAMLLFSPLVPAIVRRFGNRCMALGCLLIEAAMFVALGLFDNLPAWFVIRFVMGASGAGLFIASESWINTIADEHNRGRILGVYATVLAGAFAAGPLLILWLGTEGQLPFLAGAVLCLLAVVPMLHPRLIVPGMKSKPGFNVFSVLFLAPTIALAVLIFGFVETGAMALLPVYAVDYGLDKKQAAMVLTALGAGNVALQIPVGWLSDRINRRVVMLGCACFGALGALLLPVVVTQGIWLWVMLFFWGGLFAGLYTVAMAMVGDRFRGGELVTATAALGVFYSAGNIAGPVSNGWAMDLMGSDGLSWTLAASCGLLIAVAALRGLAGTRQR